MTTTIIRKPKNPREHRQQQEQKLADPRNHMQGFDLAMTLDEIKSAVNDSLPFYERLERAENTRKCQWPGKHPSGRKKSTTAKPARPWNNAADHEVHLSQKVLLQLTALCTAAMARGSLTVTPTNASTDDTRAAATMKLVMRYYLETAMRGERVIEGTRWASWARRWGHAVLYIGWKTVKALEKREVRESELVQFQAQQMAAALADGNPQAALILNDQLVDQAREQIRSMPADDLAALLLKVKPDLATRGKAAMSEARRTVDKLRAAIANEEDPKAVYNTAFILENRPTWEALRPGVDFLCPPETRHEETFNNARWIYRPRWLSIQQVREEGAMRGWDPQWVLEVTTKHTGRASLFNTVAENRGWILGGIDIGKEATNRDTAKHMVQIGELFERRTTEDGIQCTFRTVLHPDVKGRVASRELLDDWHGHYPFVVATNEQDEPFLINNRGVPELTKSAQDAIKTQVDSRDDMASLTTLPPWTGPETLEDTVIAPGKYIPTWRTGSVETVKFPPPDGRSIEIENALRAEVDNYFGLISKSVPDALTQLLGQAGADWFLSSYSRAIALTAMLVQQRMPEMTGARITGTPVTFNASREEVRGSFDFLVRFDVKTLDLEWFKEVITFAKDAMTAFDQRQITDKRVFLEMAYNMIDPTLVERALKSEDAARDSELEDIRTILASIFSGDATPPFPMGVDYQTRADEMISNMQGSPVRQQILATVPEVAAVWEDYLQKLLHQIEQQTTNRRAGIEGGSDPLRQSPLAQLKAGGWQAFR